MTDQPQPFTPRLQGHLREAFDEAWALIPDRVFQVVVPVSMAELLEDTIKLQSREAFLSKEARAMAALMKLLGEQ